jgi:eukaryotic-like serine/threonine-protein kinase
MRALNRCGHRIVSAGCALLLVSGCGAGNEVEPAVRTEMVAVGAAPGRQLWRTPLDEELIGSPAVADGLVYVYGGSYHDDPRGRLFALSASTGKVVWQVATHGGQCGGAAAYHKTPQVAGGVVVLRGPAGHLSGLDARSGRERWRVPTGDVPVASTSARVIVGVPEPGSTQTPGALRALDRRTGRTLWTTRFRPGELTERLDLDDAKAPIAAATDAVVLTQVGPNPYLPPGVSGLVALDAATGRERWRTTLGYVAQADPALSESATVVTTLRGPMTPAAYLTVDPKTLPAPAYAVDALDVATGASRWTWPVAAEDSGPPVTAVWAGPRTAYFFPDGERLVAADARTGRLRWQSAPLRSTPRGIPDPETVTADARIVVLTGTGGVSALAATDGSQLWRLQQARIPVTVIPAITGGTVLLPQSGGSCSGVRTR